MNKRKTIRAAALWSVLAGSSVSGIAGCYSLHGGASHDPVADVPKGSMPSEPGAYVNEFIFRQCAKAEADDFVFYNLEWVEDSAELGPAGRRHLAAVSRRLEADAPFGIMIAPTTDAKLDQERFLAITDILGQLGIPEPATRVRIGVPAAEGLYGDEAQNAYGRLIQGNVGNFGGLGGGGFGGGLGGGGFGGGLGGGGFGGGFGGGGFGGVGGGSFGGGGGLYR